MLTKWFIERQTSQTEDINESFSLSRMRVNSDFTGRDKKTTFQVKKQKRCRELRVNTEHVLTHNERGWSITVVSILGLDA